MNGQEKLLVRPPADILIPSRAYFIEPPAQNSEVGCAVLDNCFRVGTSLGHNGYSRYKTIGKPGRTAPPEDLVRKRFRSTTAQLHHPHLNVGYRDTDGLCLTLSQSYILQGGLQHEF